MSLKAHEEWIGLYAMQVDMEHAGTWQMLYQLRGMMSLQSKKGGSNETREANSANDVLSHGAGRVGLSATGGSGSATTGRWGI
jgi:hypothetical protein